MKVIIEADGGSRGNPGPAGYGAVVKSPSGEVLAESAEAIGVATNNVAEYRGLIAGLTAAIDLGATEAEVRMDSKLVIEQMAGRWKIKNEGLRPLAVEAGALARRLKVTWGWIPRERNTHADRLANEAMDAAAKGMRWQAKTVSATSTSATSTSTTSTYTTSSSTTSTSVSLGPGWSRPTRSATTLMLLRHGETPLSIEKRFSGVGDPPLTPRGVAQAEAAAARLAREPYRLGAVVTSPLTRARQTAEAVAARCGLPVLVDDGLRETDFGAWEGLTFAEIQERWPAELATWLADPSAAPPGGESFAVVSSRVEEARDRVVGGHEGKSVLVVSHVTPIKMLVRLALGAPMDALYRMHLDLACLSTIDYYADGPSVLRAFNDATHL